MVEMQIHAWSNEANLLLDTPTSKYSATTITQHSLSQFLNSSFIINKRKRPVMVVIRTMLVRYEAAPDPIKNKGHAGEVWQVALHMSKDVCKVYEAIIVHDFSISWTWSVMVKFQSPHVS
ncbi:hypothetical protein LTR40_013699 [Exophiala xenobiotica]|nr:hypothetical protein LTR40_013699 [Exophiala xenobiotica]